MEYDIINYTPTYISLTDLVLFLMDTSSAIIKKHFELSQAQQ